MTGWNADTAAGPLGPGSVTLVEGSSFCISSANGDIHAEYPHGVFYEDTRILSGWHLTVNGAPLEPLAANRWQRLGQGQMGGGSAHPGDPVLEIGAQGSRSAPAPVNRHSAPRSRRIRPGPAGGLMPIVPPGCGEPSGSRAPGAGGRRCDRGRKSGRARESCGRGNRLRSARVAKRCSHG